MINKAIFKLLDLLNESATIHQIQEAKTLFEPSMYMAIGNIITSQEFDIENLQKIPKEYILYLLYFKYLRRVPDENVIKNSLNFKGSNIEFINAYKNSIINSGEYKKNGRRVPSLESITQKASDNKKIINYIIIDVTNTFISQARTGIQRVVRELAKNFKKNEKIVYFNVNKNRFFELNINNDGEMLDTNIAVFFQKGDIYFDLDGSWGDPLSRWDLYKNLKKIGTRIINLHYDAVPILYPHCSHPTTLLRYIEHFFAAITFSDCFIAISEAVKRDLAEICRKIQYRLPRTIVVPLAGNFSTSNKKIESISREMQNFCLEKDFVLCVGTIEPRKNYNLILENISLFEKLDLRVVIVGKEGWESKTIIDELVFFTQRKNSSLKWFSHVNDSELVWLYEHCKFYLNTSLYEGFGLPVSEALLYNCKVVSSSRGALPEAARGEALLFDPNNKEDFINNILIACRENTNLIEKNQKVLGKIYTWLDVSMQIEQILAEYNSKALTPFKNGLDLVYISIREENLDLSIKSFYLNAKINSVTVLTSKKHSESINNLLKKYKFHKNIIFDEDLLKDTPLPDDHQERNFLLRKKLYCNDKLPLVFLGLDDDALLLKQLPTNHYFSNSKYISYYFFDDMGCWKASPFGISSYDYGQWNTANILREFGYGSESFSSHQPQIIIKSLNKEVYDELEFLDLKNVDEWSLPINILQSRYSNLFTKKRTTTLNWPESFSSWIPSFFIDEIIYDNYYPTNKTVDLKIHIDKFQQRISEKKIEYILHKQQYNILPIFDKEATIICTANNKSLSYSFDGAIIGYIDLWFRIPVEGISTSILCLYRILDEGENLVVNGTRDHQNISDKTGVMIKLPNRPGRFILELHLMPSTNASVVLFLPVFTFNNY
ncbi:MAG: glycosyltransferase family 1 protein [Candidatus Thiocaldithrix dubininis]|uniref:Glycosyltransferase family 1 protein n=1 Tax=Candidatus Thiocaldithrix dubininis TaxID=3080823 RepID=A0AA95KJZ4_9GAMM|nr:MAG: glycosyltransferase family 1 protein [Candidatus Thiocaldithrix dubininis]